VITQWEEFERHHDIIKETLPKSKLASEMPYYLTAEAFHELCSEMGKDRLIHEFGSISLARHREIGPRLRQFLRLKLHEWGTKSWEPKAKDSGNEEWLKYLSENPRKTRVRRI
jgi:hypothetical protein